MTEQELATRLQRFEGALLDGIIFMAIEIPVMFMFGVVQQIMHGHSMTFGQTAGFFAFHLVLFAALNGWLLAKRGQTIGKVAAGTRIVGLDGALRPFTIVYFVRYALPGVIMSIPFVSGLFSLVDALFVFRKDKRCIHDLMAGTRVVLAK